MHNCGYIIFFQLFQNVKKTRKLFSLCFHSNNVEIPIISITILSCGKKLCRPSVKLFSLLFFQFLIIVFKTEKKEIFQFLVQNCEQEEEEEKCGTHTYTSIIGKCFVGKFGKFLLHTTNIRHTQKRTHGLLLKNR